jgi:signal transduction histidine kinase
MGGRDAIGADEKGHTVFDEHFIAALLNFLIASSALGMAQLVLWQDVRRTTNQLFGGFLLALSAYGVISVLLRYSVEFGIDLKDWTRASTVAFVVALVSLLLFSFEFARDARFWPRIGQAAALVVGVVGVTYLSLGDWLTEPVINSAGHVEYDTSTAADVLMLVAVSLQGASAWALWTSKQPGARAVFWPVVLTPLGFAAFFVPPLENLPMLSLTYAVVAVLVSRVVLRLQLFDPLRRLNANLKAANDQLNATMRELAATNVELKEATTKQSEFMARMSHELRTPLNAIIGFTTMMLEGGYGAMTEKQHQRLRLVQRNGENLLQLINDLLDISKISAGKLPLSRAHFDPVPVLDEIATSIQPLVHTRQLSLRCDYGRLPGIYADEARFRQIVVNLVGNAVKFTDSGSVTISARAEDGMVWFTIKDTGVGIPQSQQQRIFDEFYQAEQEQGGARRPGTGLGLAIVRQLVEMHGGTIKVESTPGEGSVFRFSMPAARANVRKAKAESAAETPPAAVV